jgi:hypothetical protein
MPEPRRRLILANGENYLSDVVKKRRGGPPEWPRTYTAARDLVKTEVTNALQKFAALPTRKRFDDEVVLCLRLHPDMTAKSYDPSGLFGVVRDLENVGSRNYHLPITGVAQTKRIKKQFEQEIQQITGRMVFVRSNDAGFQRLLRVLDRPERELHDVFCHEIQSIEKFDLLSPSEQLLGFPPDWREGRIELVLHPSQHTEEEQTHFMRELFRGHDVSRRKTRVAPYPDGPTFVSCYLTHAALDEIAGANPLRAAHPLVLGGLEDLRGAPKFPAPPPPVTSTRSTIRVGVFDGGIDQLHPLLRGQVEQDEALSIKTPTGVDFIAHGTAVTGAVLYGALNEYDTQLPLPTPAVSVVSIRVLPTSDPKDADLYECIDVIEAAVPARPDVKFWNISFGPRGPILDDTISRFTYALDMLAVAHKAGFCVAVGNDGEAGPGLSRLQSPSDLVNGLGVGAYTQRKGKNVHAPYSCQGPGRECAKLKPDVVAFGGCDQSPIHLVAATHGTKVLSHGTSFASPIVAAMGGQTLGILERGTALLARTLLIHTAQHPDGEPDGFLGHGIIPASIDHVLRCGEKEVTIIFQGELIAKRQVKLPILLPPDVVATGRVEMTWTVAALPPVSPNHPADYTTLCIQDTFYPNSQVFSFTKKDSSGRQKSRKLHLKNNAQEIKTLVAEGWRKSAFPASESGNAYPTEHESRSLDYKWDAIVRRSINKNASSLHEPFLVLHAIPRHGTTARLDYAAVVTISAPKFNGDLYDAVLRRFTALQPVRLRTEAELRIQI